MAVDFDDRVLDIDHHSFGVDPGEHRGVFGECAQQPGRDGVELANVTEGELLQERPECRGCVRVVEEGVRRTVTEDRHVCDAVGFGDHAGYQGSDLAAGVGSFVGLIGRSVRYRAQ